MFFVNKASWLNNNLFVAIVANVLTILYPGRPLSLTLSSVDHWLTITNSRILVGKIQG